MASRIVVSSLLRQPLGRTTTSAAGRVCWFYRQHQLGRLAVTSAVQPARMLPMLPMLPMVSHRLFASVPAGDDAHVRAGQPEEGSADPIVKLKRLGKQALDSGNYDEAAARYNEALAAYVERHGTRSHTDVSATLINLGNVADADGRYEQAIQFYHESIQINRSLAAIEEDKKDDLELFVATAQTNTATIHAERLHTQFEQALALHREALDTFVRIHGTRNHTNVAQVTRSIGHLYLQQQKHVEALKQYKEALGYYQAAHQSAPHADVAETLRSMGLACLYAFETQEAMKYFKESMDTYTEVLASRENLDVALNLYRIGQCHHALFEFDEAIRCYKEARDIHIAVHGTRYHLDVGNDLYFMAAAVDQHGSEGEAEATSLYREALEIYQKCPDTDPRLVESIKAIIQEA
ncbi:uncharacterized protein BJ171DRAFT_538072 [Polychytrium aggregatum]|uniref:uncharacterized protein n=1 Tax=Polychytrium aggregatum TaxID=110093 RepID=UPI0022FE2B15|nr:uncharacterized protein BJ171DRAFT_538072 [Polychytrium aggregatum]KAI9192927.1 hypothetical protein BJ171DRAFT_538072 [Polychytrium aggregatum]